MSEGWKFDGDGVDGHVVWLAVKAAWVRAGSPVGGARHQLFGAHFDRLCFVPRLTDHEAAHAIVSGQPEDSNDKLLVFAFGNCPSTSSLSTSRNNERVALSVTGTNPKCTVRRILGLYNEFAVYATEHIPVGTVIEELTRSTKDAADDPYMWKTEAGAQYDLLDGTGVVAFVNYGPANVCINEDGKLTATRPINEGGQLRRGYFMKGGLPSWYDRDYGEARPHFTTYAQLLTRLSPPDVKDLAYSTQTTSVTASASQGDGGITFVCKMKNTGDSAGVWSAALKEAGPPPPPKEKKEKWFCHYVGNCEKGLLFIQRENKAYKVDLASKEVHTLVADVYVCDGPKPN